MYSYLCIRLYWLTDLSFYLVNLSISHYLHLNAQKNAFESKKMLLSFHLKCCIGQRHPFDVHKTVFLEPSYFGNEITKLLKKIQYQLPYSFKLLIYNKLNFENKFECWNTKRNVIIKFTIVGRKLTIFWILEIYILAFNKFYEVT